MFSEKIEIKILYKIFAILILFEKRFGYFMWFCYLFNKKLSMKFNIIYKVYMYICS